MAKIQETENVILDDLDEKPICRIHIWILTKGSKNFKEFKTKMSGITSRTNEF